MPSTVADERDLSFAEVVNAQPKALTAAQLEKYNRDGYLMPFRIFDEAGAARNRAYFDSLLKQLKELNDGRDTYAINGFHTHCEGIYDLVMNPRILDLVQDILGRDFVCWGTHYFCKIPHDPKAVPMHQDASYWPFTPARTVTVWLAIDDASIENACMSVIRKARTAADIWNGNARPRTRCWNRRLKILSATARPFRLN